MKRTVLATALILSTGVAFAQAPAAPAAPANVPKPNCGKQPEYPGKLAMQSEMRRNSFKRELDTYKACMMAFVEEYKAKQAAAFAAANAAIQDYNDTMKKIAADQDATN